MTFRLMAGEQMANLNMTPMRDPKGARSLDDYLNRNSHFVIPAKTVSDAIRIARALSKLPALEFGQAQVVEHFLASLRAARIDRKKYMLI